MNFGQFYEVHERLLKLGDMKKNYQPNVSSVCSSDNGIPNVRQIDYLWFILNPLKEPVLRKRLVLNFI